MKRIALLLLIGGIAASLFLVVVAVLSFLFLPYLQDWLSPTPQGVVLVYEVDPDCLVPGENVNMANLVKAIRRRLGYGSSTLARVRSIDDERIEVAVVGKSESDAQRIQRLLTCTGILEFRILANKRDNKDMIEQALVNPSKTRLHDSDGNLVAWWVPVRDVEASGIARYPDIAVRAAQNNGHEITEVLVLNDDYNVTGAYLARADVGIDHKGKPCVEFVFNNAGGQLFGELTGSHLPDPVHANMRYRLGIVLDGVLYSAPSINATVFDQVQISGSFTKKEVDDLARVLNSGSLPAKIRPVKK